MTRISLNLRQLTGPCKARRQASPGSWRRAVRMRLSTYRNSDFASDSVFDFVFPTLSQANVLLPSTGEGNSVTL